jgi:hypothetical protein
LSNIQHSHRKRTPESVKNNTNIVQYFVPNLVVIGNSQDTSTVRIQQHWEPGAFGANFVLIQNGKFPDGKCHLQREKKGFMKEKCANELKLNPFLVQIDLPKGNLPCHHCPIVQKQQSLLLSAASKSHPFQRDLLKFGLILRVQPKLLQFVAVQIEAVNANSAVNSLI